MRTLLLLLACGALAVLTVLWTGWALRDAGVHLPGEGATRGPAPSPTAAYPR